MSRPTVGEEVEMSAREIAMEKAREIVNKLKALQEKATPGPWQIQDCDDVDDFIGARTWDAFIKVAVYLDGKHSPEGVYNAKLIVAAVNAISELEAALALSAESAAQGEEKRAHKQPFGLEGALLRLESRFCSCDVMTGWSCGIHEDIKLVRAAIRTQAQPAARGHQWGCPAWSSGDDGECDCGFTRSSQVGEVETGKEGSGKTGPSQPAEEQPATATERARKLTEDFAKEFINSYLKAPTSVPEAWLINHIAAEFAQVRKDAMEAAAQWLDGEGYGIQADAIRALPAQPAEPVAPGDEKRALFEAIERELRELVAKWRDIKRNWIEAISDGNDPISDHDDAMAYGLCADEMERILNREGQPPAQGWEDHVAAKLEPIAPRSGQGEPPQLAQSPEEFRVLDVDDRTMAERHPSLRKPPAASEGLVEKWRKFADTDYTNGQKLSDAKKQGQYELMMAGQCLAYATAADELAAHSRAFVEEVEKLRKPESGLRAAIWRSGWNASLNTVLALAKEFWGGK